MPYSELYIREHKLQDPKEKRKINADDKLKAVFNGKLKVSMFEMTNSSVCGLFKWRQIEPEVIPHAIGWYLRFSLLDWANFRSVEIPSGFASY